MCIWLSTHLHLLSHSSLFYLLLPCRLLHSVLQQSFSPHFHVSPHVLFLFNPSLPSPSVHFHLVHFLYPTFCLSLFFSSLFPTSNLFPSSTSLFSGASLTPFIHLSSRQWIRFQRLLYMPHSLNPSLCFPTTFHTHTYPPHTYTHTQFPFPFSLLSLLSRSNLLPEGSDWQASGGLVKGSFWLVAREMKRRKPPGPAPSTLQKTKKY